VKFNTLILILLPLILLKFTKLDQIIEDKTSINPEIIEITAVIKLSFISRTLF
jgi:hypothetical protein